MPKAPSAHSLAFVNISAAQEFRTSASRCTTLYYGTILGPLLSLLKDINFAKSLGLPGWKDTPWPPIAEEARVANTNWITIGSGDQQLGSPIPIDHQLISNWCVFSIQGMSVCAGPRATSVQVSRGPIRSCCWDMLWHEPSITVCPGAKLGANMMAKSVPFSIQIPFARCLSEDWRYFENLSVQTSHDISRMAKAS